MRPLTLRGLPMNGTTYALILEAVDPDHAKTEAWYAAESDSDVCLTAQLDT